MLASRLIEVDVAAHHNRDVQRLQVGDKRSLNGLTGTDFNCSFL